MKPVLILPKGGMSADDIKRLRDNGICVVEAKDPSHVRFTEPPIGGPILERAAISLARELLSGDNYYGLSRADARAKYARIIVEGSSLSAVPPNKPSPK